MKAPLKFWCVVLLFDLVIVLSCARLAQLAEPTIKQAEKPAAAQEWKR